MLYFSESQRDTISKTLISSSVCVKGRHNPSSNITTIHAPYYESGNEPQGSRSKGSLASTLRKKKLHHRANDEGWEAIRAIKTKEGSLGLQHFRIVKQLGCGDIGGVYLSELRSDTSCSFAIKVMDKGALGGRNKLLRSHTEREILESLDHPFLPTLYTAIESSRYLCLVMEYCPGGDLHHLRQLQLGKRFHIAAARFYAGEVLLALEYLHMLGVVYRDLKPENVLVRGDGHIMLSDFDLSLKCDVSPTLIQSTTTIGAHKPKKRTYLLSSCIKLCKREMRNMYCIPKEFDHKLKKENCKRKVVPLPKLIVEPTSVRSMSFVGTHEYLAPEIISGSGHGSAVDWWTFGIFLYELLYGRTPFKGEDNESTLLNVLTQPLRFPIDKGINESTKSLIKGLLVKDPEKRLASTRGAADIKQHPFFEGLNWALIRSTSPPQIPTLNSKTLSNFEYF